MNNQEPISKPVRVSSLEFELEQATITADRCRSLLQLVGVDVAVPASRKLVTVVVAALNRVWPLPLSLEDIAHSEQISSSDTKAIGEDLVTLELAEEVREDTIRLLAKIPLRSRGKAEAAKVQ